MRAAEVLRTIDPLPYGDRMRFVAATARHLRGTPELTSLLAELASLGPFERGLSLQLARIANETEHVASLLLDPDPALRARAIAAVGRGVPVPDSVLRGLFEDAPAVVRRQLRKVLHGRPELVGSLIDEQRKLWGDPTAADLLIDADTTTIRRLLPELSYCLSVGQWRRLGRRHPALVLDRAEAALAGVNDNEGRKRWWNSLGYGVAAALPIHPARVTVLIAKALPATDVPRAVIDVLGPLVEADPALVLALFDNRAKSIRPAMTLAFRRRLWRFSDEQLARWGALAWPDETVLAGLLDRLPPSRRTAVFRAALASVELGQTVFSPALVDVLPTAERHAQARRMLALKKVKDDQRLRWQVTSYLPYDEAFALLEAEIQQPEADDRTAIYEAVLGAAGRSRDPEVVTRALAWITRMRNDREPVRTAVLNAAARISVSLLTDAQVPALTTLLTDALEARDTSWATRAALTSLAQNAVRQGSLRAQPHLLRWAVDAHASLSGSVGSVQLRGLTDGLPRGDELAVYEALKPYIDAGADRLEFDLAFAVAASFHRRGWGIDHLDKVLEKAVWSNQEYTVGDAVRYWLAPPATRAERVQRIIKRDVGMAQWDPVWTAVTEGRTDLLDKVLAKPRRIRRFEYNYPRWEVSSRAIARWLPRQHQRYADLVADAARDERMPEWSRAQAIETLGRIPQLGRRLVEPFLRSSEVLLVEAALAALAWTDHPDEVVPTLLTYAGNDRARVAIYAAARAVRYVRPSQLALALSPLLLGEGAKVTSRKEAARLLGELRAPGAVDVLAQAWPSAHRDVRAAITSVVAQYLLHDPSAWDVLRLAVDDSVATARTLVARPPLSVPSECRTRYGGLVLAVTNRPESEAVCAALSALETWGRWTPATGSACSMFVTDLGTPSLVWRAAAKTLAAVTAIGCTDDTIEVLQLLAQLDESPTRPEAEADRDRPARQRLLVVVGLLASTLRREAPERRTSLREIADSLPDSYLPQRLDLLLATLEGNALIKALPELADLVAGSPYTAVVLGQKVGSALKADTKTWNLEDVDTTFARLYGRSDLAGGLIALALVGATGQRTQWSPEWRARLIDLRRHPHPDIHHAALTITTAPE
ncbi:hypothetical protein [Kribbella deserti]|uniref:HEAT repeat domain-containing protein n=1 Tax=Kribbella deserti TaxID=1926257 RepID=A0ABV6QDN3_9ACTN